MHLHLPTAPRGRLPLLLRPELRPVVILIDCGCHAQLVPSLLFANHMKFFLLCNLKGRARFLFVTVLYNNAGYSNHHFCHHCEISPPSTSHFTFRFIGVPIAKLGSIWGHILQRSCLSESSFLAKLEWKLSSACVYIAK